MALSTFITEDLCKHIIMQCTHNVIIYESSVLDLGHLKASLDCSWTDGMQYFSTSAQHRSTLTNGSLRNFNTEKGHTYDGSPWSSPEVCEQNQLQIGWLLQLFCSDKKAEGRS